MSWRNYLLGFLSCALLCGCAGFAYKSYGLDGVNYSNGKLLAISPKDDRPFMDCAPTAAVKHPCMVMFAKEFYALKTDFEDTQNRLKKCEADHAQTLK